MDQRNRISPIIKDGLVMTFDTENQRSIVLQLIAVSSIPGKALDELYEFKKAVESAEVKEKVKTKDRGVNG